MTLKTFLPKWGLVRYQVKRWWWISALYALFLFFSVPFLILNENLEYLLDRVNRYPDMVGSVIYDNVGMFIFLIAAAVIIGVCVFRYMQEVRSATLFHAMPVTRAQLYTSTLLAGVILLAMPIIANALILLCMSLFGGYLTIIPPWCILDWVGGQILTGMATMFFCIFVGMITGSSIGQLLFTFAISAAPLGVVAVCAYLLNNWLFGFTASGMEPTLTFMAKLLPYYAPQFIGNNGTTWWIPVLAGVYVILFGVLGYVLYRKRDVERAGDVAAFRFVRPIFLYSVTLCMMLAGTAFVGAITGYYGGGPNLLVLLLFALLGYAVAKMLLIKSFRILPYYKGFVVFAVIVLFVFSAVDSNIFGFGTTVPEEHKIVEAYVGDYYNTNWHRDDFFRGHYNGVAILKDAEGIAAVRDLHRGAIGNNVPYSDRDARRTVFFSYELKSGRIVTRAYEMQEYQLFSLFSTDAAKDSIYPNFRLYPERIAYIDLPDLNGLQIFGEQKEGLIEAVRKDLDRLTYQEIINYVAVPEIVYEETIGDPVVTVQEQIDWNEKFPDDLPIRSLQVHVVTDEEYEGVVGNFGMDGEKEYTFWFSINGNFTETIKWFVNNGYMTIE